jgi:hypothetical protein
MKTQCVDGWVRERGKVILRMYRQKKREIKQWITKGTDPSASIKSEFFVLVLYLIRFEHARNPHCRLSLLFRLSLNLRFLFFQEKLRVVPRGEFFELNEEVTQCQLETIDIVVVLAQSVNERMHLGTVEAKVRLELDTWKSDKKDDVHLYMRERRFEQVGAMFP